MDDRLKAHGEHWERIGYLPALREFAMARCAPFFWSAGQGRSVRLLHSGTICYVNTGKRHIGITADHVYRQYLADLQEFPDVEAQFNGNTIRPEQRLIDRHEPWISPPSTCHRYSLAPTRTTESFTHPPSGRHRR